MESGIDKVFFQDFITYPNKKNKKAGNQQPPTDNFFNFYCYFNFYYGTNLQVKHLST